MIHRNKLVQSWSTQDGVEWEADLRDVEEDAFRAEALCRPECDWEVDESITDIRPTHKNGHDGWSFPIGIYNFFKAARLMRLWAAPPLIRT
jgi:hypothetical protein